MSGLRRHWPLIAVLAVAVAVRLWGVDWGLPYIYDADEPNNLSRTLIMLQSGDANPHWFHYPSLVFYVYGGVLAATTVFLDVLGIGAGIAALESPQLIAGATGLLNEPWTLMVPRLTSIVISVATVALVYFIVNRLTRRPWAAGFGALLLALAPIAVSEGRLFAPNTLSAFFATAALGASFLVLEKGRVQDYVIAGVLIGLATGSKYNAGFVGLAVVAAHLLRRRAGQPLYARGPLIAIYTALGTFLLTTPFAVLDARSFLGDLGFELVHYSSGHSGAEGGLGVYGGVGLTLLSFSLLFLPFAWRDRQLRSYTLISLLFGLGYMLFLSLFQTTFARNLLPALPALCVAVGLGAAAAAKKSRNMTTLTKGALTAAAIAAVLVAGGALWTEYANLEDRTAAIEWAEASLPHDSVVIVEAYSPWIDPQVFELVTVGYVINQQYPEDWDFLLLTNEGSGRFLNRPELYPTEIAAIAEIRAATCLVKEFPELLEIRAPDCSYQLAN